MICHNIEGITRNRTDLDLFETPREVLAESEKLSTFLTLAVHSFLTLFPTAFFFHGSHKGAGWLPSPYGKSTWECLSPILFYRVTYTYIDRLNPKGKASKL
jgi:hypothetical protein